MKIEKSVSPLETYYDAGDCAHLNPTHQFLEDVNRLSEFALCDTMRCAVEDTYDFEDLNSWNQEIPWHHRIVFFTQSVTGFLLCEGADRFMRLDCQHSAYAECFDAIGLPTMADECREYIAHVQPEFLGDDIYHDEYFDKIDRETPFVAKFWKALLANKNAIESNLATFIRANPESFRELHDAMKWTLSYLEELYPERVPHFHKANRLATERVLRGPIGYWWYRVQLFFGWRSLNEPIVWPTK